MNEKKLPIIIFCLPGDNFSGRFLESFLLLINFCHQVNIKYYLSRKESPVIYYVRNMCLGGDLRRGMDQKPFDGKLEYTHLMWIDSDMIFSVDHFKALLRRDKDIISGIYKMADTTRFSVVEKWDEEYFKQYGSFQFLNEADMKKKDGLFEAVYTGFGFTLIKHGVFEALQYPWFEPLSFQFGNIKEFCSEDVAFCQKAKLKGFNIWVDPAVRVGHEKKVIL
jgi:hypothetical protein